MMRMSWSPQQERAIKSVREWLSQRGGSQCFRLFGFAGSGKTTLAKELAAGVKGPVVFATFTGKAALVLTKKGCPACTIHSLIYKAVEDEVTGEVTFKLNPESAAANAALIVIDEVSMVGEDLAQDLLSYGCKVLVLGDPEQLPPVKGEGFFINAEPDVMLTEVHRQARDNPIIQLSMDVREGRGLKPGTYGDSRVIMRSSITKDELRELAMGADQMLCGLNKTRQTLNTRVRAIKGLAGELEPWHPVPTDRLVCLKNNKEKGFLNGGLWELQTANVASKCASVRVQSLDLPELSPIDTDVLLPFFNGTEKELDWKVKKGFDELTYGYCLTVHKSQGSQWDNVLLMDESFVFRDVARKHLYTGVTRASERVTVVV